MEDNLYCHYDYLKLSDDSGYSSDKLCGTGVSYTHVLSSPMEVHFHSDDSQVDTGFSMHYEALPGKYNTPLVYDAYS